MRFKDKVTAMGGGQNLVAVLAFQVAAVGGTDKVVFVQTSPVAVLQSLQDDISCGVCRHFLRSTRA